MKNKKLTEKEIIEISKTNINQGFDICSMCGGVQLANTMNAKNDVDFDLICDECRIKKIVFMDGFDSVRDAETQSKEIFSTKLPEDLAASVGRTHIPSEVVDNAVINYNSSGLMALDNYLLYEEKITQDEREIIVEAIATYQENISK